MANSEKVWLSIIIPLYNEEQRIKESYEKVLAHFKKKPFGWEILMVDDGSSDDTVSSVTTLIKGQKNIKLLSLPKHLGKGGAIRGGMLKARGKYIFFIDADLSTPIEEFDRFEPELITGWDVIIGSRKKAGAHIDRHQPFLREFMGKGFTLLSNLLVTRGISDFTCGFKCFSKDSAKLVFSKQRIRDWSFDAEVLFLSRKFRFTIKEIPVHWHDVSGTKVNLFRDTLLSLLGLVKIKVYNVLGLYAR